MPIASRWARPIPELSLQSYLFGSPTGPLPAGKAFVDAGNPSRSLTFDEFRLYSKKIGRGLQALGVGPGDTVLLFSGNELFVPCLFLGAIMAGAVFTGASPAFGPRELAYQLEDSRATVVVAATGVLDVAVEAAKLTRLPEPRIFAFDGRTAPPRGPPGAPGASGASHADVAHWTSLFAPDRDAEAFQWQEPADLRGETCCLNYSSGTTGRPKGVEVTHYSYVANTETGKVRSDLQAEAWGETYDGRALCFMPLYHAAAQTAYMIGAPKQGTTSYIMSAYSLDRMLQHIQEFRITDLVVAPPVVAALVASPLSRKYDLSSVRNIICGTAPLAPGLADRASGLFGDERVKLRQGWGMTELTCTGSMVDPRIPDGSPSSVGEAAPNSAIKVMDGSQEVTEPHRRGELWFTGPTLMKGYWRNAEATAHALVEDKDGVRWLRTGDIVYLDSYGPGANIHVIDRQKELIKVKGFQVAPAELEAVLMTRPDVADVGVVGVTINGAEAPRAYIVRSPGSTPTADEICRWMEGQVAAYKRLRGGVAFVDEIPRVPSGKILRRVLRERAQSEAANGAVPATARPKLA
ncbi:4-coumarate--CoA ligase-like 7 [Tolypocladium ophioglossoides CBS 100239]|uniref:4-coumarate--CoA ligase-like 7 n=1 Tax=Tolypocladium ophioglossoides (strain CBS 100239) TaxID=1163406 RepID=A0A0L0N8Q0_TOLOC|nr:4-coumarate--CoA ligase-like 7 [Tolypocladium ophioglossoides CBS 100239]